MKSYGLDADFRYVCTVTLTLEIWPWVTVVTHHWVMNNNRVKYYQVQLGTEELWPGHGFLVFVHWPWPWRYNLGSRSWHTLRLWTTIVWNIIQIQLGTEELWPGHEFLVFVHYDLDLRDITWGQGHDTPLGHGQQLCEILSRSDKGVRRGQNSEECMCHLLNIAMGVWQTDGQTDGRTDDGQSDPYVSLCFAGDTKSKYKALVELDFPFICIF